MKTKINDKNSAAIEAALKKSNGNATAHTFRSVEKPVGGIYKVGSYWTLEFPAPLGVTTHESLKAATEAAKKAGLAVKRWYNCDEAK